MSSELYIKPDWKKFWNFIVDKAGGWAENVSSDIFGFFDGAIKFFQTLGFGGSSIENTQTIIPTFHDMAGKIIESATRAAKTEPPSMPYKQETDIQSPPPTPSGAAKTPNSNQK